jgi:hypothetical protein
MLQVLSQVRHECRRLLASRLLWCISRLEKRKKTMNKWMTASLAISVWAMSAAWAQEAMPTCPAWGCQPENSVTQPEFAVPAGYYEQYYRNGSDTDWITLQITSEGATIYEGRSSDNTVEAVAHLPKLMMDLSNHFVAKGTMAPVCARGHACPEFIRLIEVSGTYYPPTDSRGVTSAIELSLAGQEFHVVRQAPVR